MQPVIPERVDLRPRLPPVRDQGGRSTCLAFAVTSAHEVLRANQKGEVEVRQFLSEEFLYWECKQIDNLSVPETTPDATNLALQQSGQPPAEHCPYHLMRADEDFSVAPRPDVDPTQCLKAQLQDVKATPEELKAHLASGRTVVLGIEINTGFHYAAEGLVPVPPIGQILDGGHAILLVGYDDRKDGGCWIFRNSWGSGWGDSGYGYLPYDYVLRHGAEAWTVEPSPV